MSKYVKFIVDGSTIEAHIDQTKIVAVSGNPDETHSFIYLEKHCFKVKGSLKQIMNRLNDE